MITAAEVKFYGKSYEQIQRDIVEQHGKDVEEMEQRLAKLRDSLGGRLARMHRQAETVAAACNAGFDVSAMPGYGVHLTVNAEQLPKVRAAFGRLTLQGKLIAMEYEVKEAGLTGDCVKLLLKSEQYPDLSVWYVRPLREDDPCQIVEVTKTERQLVCGIKPTAEPELASVGATSGTDEPPY